MGSVEALPKSGIPALLVDDIPNCSANDQLLLELITDDECDLDQLAMFIEESPALVAMIVGLANSAYFSAPTPITTVSDAIIKVLGMRTVRSVVLSVILGRSLDLTYCENFNALNYWADALTVARFCQILTMNSDFKKLVSVDQIYLSGLLANFGQLVLVHHYPKVMNEVFESAEGVLERQIELQRVHLGMTQAEAGVLLGRKWHLPTMVINTMHYNLDKDYLGQDWAICQLVGEVSVLVNKVVLGDENLFLSPECEKILNVSSDDCRLEELVDLRQELVAIAQYLQSST